MHYLDGVDKLRHIEKTYDVMSITFRNVPVWPFLRIYILQVLGETNNRNAHEVSMSKVSLVVKSILKYNPFIWFRSYPVWLFNARERRKNVAGKWVHRVSGFMNELGVKFLDIEKPSPSVPDIPRKFTDEHYLTSEGLPIMGAHLIERFLRLFRLKINNENLLSEIVREYAPEFDYKYFVRYLWSQKLAMTGLLALSRSPKVSVMECPYNMMGYIWALKKKGIKVIELQHGVINNSHYAYIFPHESIFSPDELWVYGNEEYEFFSRENPHYSSVVKQTGLYILHLAKEAFTDDIFKTCRDTYKKIVVFTGQTLVENEVKCFIREAAVLNPDILFVYIPRNAEESFDVKASNVLFRPGVNVYEYLKWCDIHMTVSSTTCLEACYFQKPTVFYNLYNLATTYYGKQFTGSKCAAFVSNPTDLSQALESFNGTEDSDFVSRFAPFSLDQISAFLGVSKN